MTGTVTIAAAGIGSLQFVSATPTSIGLKGTGLNETSTVIFKVLEHRASAPKPLAEVRESIVAAIAKEQGTQAALSAAQRARDELLKGSSFDAVATQLKVSADPAHFISRNDPSVPAQVRDAAFAVPRPAGKPEFRALTLNDGGAALLAVSAVRTAAAHDNDAQASRAQQETDRLGTGAVMAYVDEVRRTANVRKNPKAFE